jgi:hypothetical protein
MDLGYWVSAGLVLGSAVSIYWLPRNPPSPPELRASDTQHKMQQVEPLHHGQRVQAAPGGGGGGGGGGLRAADVERNGETESLLPPPAVDE